MKSSVKTPGVEKTRTITGRRNPEKSIKLLWK